MGKTFENATAFRMSLEQRLKTLAAESSLPINSLRLRVVIERLLARLFAVDDPPWLLKGGYAMELRYRPRARTTKDVDLSMAAVSTEADSQWQQVREQLQAAAALDNGDFFQFEIALPTTELVGAPGGGARFPVNAILAGRSFARFHLDVGLGDPLLSPPELLIGQDFLSFAGIPPARAIAIPVSQQFAEKVHAYSHPWTDRENTRTKDLVDLVLFITTDPPDLSELRKAITKTFETRATHELPVQLAPPPKAWMASYAEMATEAQLPDSELSAGFHVLDDYWKRLFP